MANKKKFLSKEQIVAAQGKTLSNMAAARYLHVSYQHYKKYAKMYNLFESHKNQAGKGVPKFLKGPKKMPHMIEIIEGRIAASSFNPNKLKYALIEQGYLLEECAVCGFKESDFPGLNTQQNQINQKIYYSKGYFKNSRCKRGFIR